MSQKNVNTKDLLKRPAKSETQIQAEMKQLARRMGNDVKMRTLLIPEAYRSAFGDPLIYSVQGLQIEVPIGVEIKVPEPHYLHAQRLLKGAVISKNQKRLTPEEVYSK